MCGRGRCTLRAEDITRACGVNHGSVRTVQMDRYRPSFNVTPGSYLPVIRREDEDGSSGGSAAVLHCMKWGLIPSFTKKTEKPDHYKMFNAQSESISEKASFRRLIPNNRCLVAIEGFYEWKKDGSKKQPYYIHFRDGQPLLLAALYDSWRNSDGDILYTFTIVTTCSSSALQWLHDRMPVILGGEGSSDAWLNGSSSSKFDTVLKPYEDSNLVWYPVTPAMGKPSFDGPECIKEIHLKVEVNTISKFFSRKTIDDEQELEPHVKSSFEESAGTNLPDSFKVEPGTKETTESLTNSETDKNDPKLDEVEKCGTKRYYEEFAVDTKQSTCKMKKLIKSPMKKKGNTKNEADNQPTLLSYFGRS